MARSRMSSRPEESHPRALPDPCVNLSIHTAPDVQPLAHAASSFTSSTSSSCCQLASVGPWPRLNNAAPSLQPHYRTFTTTTVAPSLCSASVLSSSRFWPLETSLFASEQQVLTFHTRAWLNFAPPTCRMPLGQASGFRRVDPRGRVSPLLASSNRFSTRHQRFACARLSQPCLPESCPGVSATLTTVAFHDSSLWLLEART